MIASPQGYEGTAEMWQESVEGEHFFWSFSDRNAPRKLKKCALGGSSARPGFWGDFRGCGGRSRTPALGAVFGDFVCMLLSFCSITAFALFWFFAKSKEGSVNI